MRVNKPAVTVVLVGACVTALTIFDQLAPGRLAAQVSELNVGSGNSEDYGVDWSKVNLGGERREAIRDRLVGHKSDPVRFPIPRTKWDGKPDLNGVYGDSVRLGRPAANLEPLYRPEVKTLRESTEVINWKNGYENPTFHCWPRPVLSGSQGANSGLQILHNPDHIVMIDEQDGRFRIIPLVDGPGAVKHNPAHTPSYMGDSIAYWEGDTLVIDVANFNGRVWLGEGDIEAGRPPQTTSTELHIVERLVMGDGKMLDYQPVRVEDPKMLTGVFEGVKVRREKQPYDQILEAICEELPDLAEKEAQYKSFSESSK